MVLGRYSELTTIFPRASLVLHSHKFYSYMYKLPFGDHKSLKQDLSISLMPF